MSKYEILDGFVNGVAVTLSAPLKLLGVDVGPRSDAADTLGYDLGRAAGIPNTTKIRHHNRPPEGIDI
jgi:hypothetical protein